MGRQEHKNTANKVPNTSPLTLEHAVGPLVGRGRGVGLVLEVADVEAVAAIGRGGIGICGWCSWVGVFWGQMRDCESIFKNLHVC